VRISLIASAVPGLHIHASLTRSLIMTKLISALRSCLLAFVIAIALRHTPTLAQQAVATPQPSPAAVEPQAEALPTSAMVLFNVVPKTAPIKCTIGTNNVVVDGTAEAIGPGFTTGLIPWRPEKEPLRAEAKGYLAAELKPFLKPGETPVVLLTEGPSGQLAFRLIPNAATRDGGFYDAINLTPDSILQITVDGKPVSLVKGKRARLSTKKKMTYALPKGQPETLEAGDDPPQHLIIFHRSATGRTECAVVPDMLMQ
jgi:hypothetical protein